MPCATFGGFGSARPLREQLRQAPPAASLPSGPDSSIAALRSLELLEDHCEEVAADLPNGDCTSRAVSLLPTRPFTASTVPLGRLTNNPVKGLRSVMESYKYGGAKHITCGELALLRAVLGNSHPAPHLA